MTEKRYGPVRLYHGSDVVVEHPDVSLNAGFADLGRGFYLTDDYEVACRRAASRARKTGATTGVVSEFEFDATALPWHIVGGGEGSKPKGEGPFGLRFAGNLAGIASWMDYVAACRRGQDRTNPWGNPDVVCAWIATEELEIALSGMVSAADMAPYIDPSELVTQYCIRSQAEADAHLRFLAGIAVG